MMLRSAAVLLALGITAGAAPAAAQSADVLVLRLTQVGFVGAVGREIHVTRDGHYRIVGIKSEETGAGRLEPGTVDSLLRTLDEQDFDSMPPRFLAWTRANPATADITAEGETRHFTDAPGTEFAQADSAALRDVAPVHRRFRVLLATLLRQLAAGGLD